MDNIECRMRNPKCLDDEDHPKFEQAMVMYEKLEKPDDLAIAVLQGCHTSDQACH